MKIQGHRGTRVLCPENTMEAFQSAKRLCADGIELDVNKVLCGSLMVCHDSNLKRMCGFDCDIFTKTGKELSDISIGYEYGNKFVNARVPYYENVLSWISENTLYLNTEIKSQPGGDETIVDDVIALLDKYNMEKRCIISSFNSSYLDIIRKKYPKYDVGYLYSSDGLKDMSSFAKEKDYQAIHPYFKLVTKKLVEKCHRYGIKVNVWTVNEEKDLKQMYDFGVDAVITDNVEFAKNVIDKILKQGE